MLGKYSGENMNKLLEPLLLGILAGIINFTIGMFIMILFPLPMWFNIATSIGMVIIHFLYYTVIKYFNLYE